MRWMVAVVSGLVLAVMLWGGSGRVAARHLRYPDLRGQLRRLIQETEGMAAKARARMRARPRDPLAVRTVATLMLSLREHRALLHSVEHPRSPAPHRWEGEEELIRLIDLSARLARTPLDRRLSGGLLDRLHTPPPLLSSHWEDTRPTASRWAAPRTTASTRVNLSQVRGAPAAARLKSKMPGPIPVAARREPT